MVRRIIVTLHLPLEMGTVARILKAIAREYPLSTVEMRQSRALVKADPDAPRAAAPK